MTRQRRFHGQSALDTLARAVFLRFLTYGERVHGAAVQPAPVGQRVGHGVGAHGEAAHVGGVQAALVEQGPGDLPDQELPLGAHGGAAGVDVVGRTRAAGECKIADAHRSLHEELFESFTMIHKRQSVRGGAYGASPDRLVADCGSARRRSAGMALAVLGLAALRGRGHSPDAIRFGQVGEIDIVLETPIGPGRRQRSSSGYVWASTGEWAIQEAISYGDADRRRTFRARREDVDRSAGRYGRRDHASQRQSRREPLRRRAGAGPESGLRIRDARASSSPSTTSSARRTATGSGVRRRLAGLRSILRRPSPEGLGAGRAGGPVRSPGYRGGRRAGSSARTMPAACRSGRSTGARRPVRRWTLPRSSPNSRSGRTFWAQHAGLRPIPPVDFDKEMVVVAMVGQREEAGDSVEVGGSSR